MSVYTSAVFTQYQNDAKAGIPEQRAKVIADSPSTVTRTREVRTDQFRGVETLTAGPYTVRLEPFRTTTGRERYDEKGTNSPGAFVLLAQGLPKNPHSVPNAAQPLFALGDELVDGDGNCYRVTTLPQWDGTAVEVNLERVA